MKIWKEFNSSHSSNITIIGKFEDVANAKGAFKMIEDFTLASWEERYPSVKEFNDYWAINFHPDIPYIGLTDRDIETGIDNYPDITLEGDTIIISSFRTDNFGGIARLMRFSGAKKIVIE
ncbi:DUF6375 family protein [Chryseobacterium taeanense]|jgi:hypothetical protein|uniref:DUF6375 family protein n=1 Tax=Chryseobacterium taeanense TaxID=311334 RepID=UPI0035B219D7